MLGAFTELVLTDEFDNDLGNFWWNLVNLIIFWKFIEVFKDLGNLRTSTKICPSTLILAFSALMILGPDFYKKPRTRATLV